MVSLLRALVVLQVLASTPTAVAVDSGRTLRFYSLMIRDKPPTADEVEALLDGDVTLDEKIEEWMESSDHQTRMRRYFSDFWPVLATFTPFWFSDLTANEQGVLRASQKPECAAEDVVSSEAWWLPAGQTVSICRTSTSDAFKYAEPQALDCNDYMGGFLDPKCGCGPSLLLCIPLELRNKLIEDNDNETRERGLYVYNNDLTWFDFIGGDFFYGNRAQYLHYVISQGRMVKGEVSADEILATLRTIPMDSQLRTAFPSGAVRAGILTTTAFLSSFNTFYARPRQAVLNLLCQDVDSRLNTDGITEIVNPSLTPEALAHAGKAGCASCHFGLDNHASTLNGYEIWGEVSPFVDFPSQAGHAFGQNGSGPAFLAQSYIERGPNFNTCMARTAWISMTGLSWDNGLSDADRASLTALAAQGPRDLIHGVIKSPPLRAGAANQ